MKKLIIFLVFLFLSFNMTIVSSMAEAKNFKQGFYKASDLKLPLDATHTVQNNSFSDRALIIILDSNQIIRQVIRLMPQSENYKLIPIEENYTVIIAGDGEVSIT